MAEVVRGEELRWPTVCARWSCIFTWTLGCVRHSRIEEKGGQRRCLPRRGWRRSRGAAAEKTSNVGDSLWLGGCNNFKEYGGASTHQLGNSVEDGRKQSGLSPVSSSGGSNGYGRVLRAGKEKEAKHGAIELL
jgi:hypothetical protein